MTSTPHSGEPLHIDVQQISSELRIRPAIYVKIVNNFALSLDGKIKILSEAIAGNNRDQMRMVLHEIKGTAGNLRLRSISNVEAAMHDAVKAGANAATLMQLFQKLEEESINLQKYVQGLPTDGSKPNN